jgi:hypothetical protein
MVRCIIERPAIAAAGWQLLYNRGRHRNLHNISGRLGKNMAHEQ